MNFVWYTLYECDTYTSYISKKQYFKLIVIFLLLKWGSLNIFFKVTKQASSIAKFQSSKSFFFFPISLFIYSEDVSCLFIDNFYDMRKKKKQLFTRVLISDRQGSNHSQDLSENLQINWYQSWFHFKAC